jgi:hypothetical protein
MYWLSPMGRQIEERAAIDALREFELRALGK